MENRLTHSIDPDGITFSLVLSDHQQPIDRWALVSQELPSSIQAAIPILLGLREAECIDEPDESSLIVPHDVVASLDKESLDKLPIPEQFEGVLSIEGSGLVTDTDFEIICQLRSPERRPYYIDSQVGCCITVGGEHFIVRDPLYTILKNVTEFNRREGATSIHQLRSWAALKQILPEEAVVDDYLQSINVALCSAFTLKECSDEDGDLSFDPIPIQKRDILKSNPLQDDSITDDPENQDIVSVLPPYLEDNFTDKFRRFGSARSSYALQDGWMIVVDDIALPGLKAVRTAQKAPPSERRSFTKNPYAGIRELTNEAYDDESLDTIFTESREFGSRVESIGKFVPTVLSYVKHSGGEWTPPESMGFSIGGEQVLVSKEDALELVETLREARAAGKEWVTHNNIEIPVNDESLRAVDTLVEAISRFKPGEKGEKKPSKELAHALLLGSKANLEELGFATPELSERASDIFIPKSLTSTLKPHQEDGLIWLQKHWAKGSPGALLADDMGLGKTIQSLAFLCWIDEMKSRVAAPHKPFLIVAPTGLLKNWIDEFELHFDSDASIGLPLEAFGNGLKNLRNRGEGSGRGNELVIGAALLDTDVMEHSKWVLTTYETLRDYSHSFGGIRWETIIFDEAQKIKNPSVLISEQARAVASNAEFVLTMTGTPVENRVTDLWSIADTCYSGLLGDLRSFINTYEGPYEEVKDKLKDLQDIVLDDGKEVPQLMLRRMKSSHLKGLPKRHEDHILRNDMPKVQKDSYFNAIHKARFSDDRKGKMLEVLHNIKSISLHPNLVADQHMSDEEFINSSARVSGAVSVLDGVRDRNEKALIFVESRAIQPTLQGIFQRRYNLSRPPLIINGAVSGFRRKGLVDQFQEQPGFDVMMLSPKAGGVGLTLTAANNVIHLSRWWNPAVEDQCSDRVYRIGQTREVNVFLPMSVFDEKPGTSFDEKLHDLLSSKRRLSRAVLAPVAHSDDDIKQLYDVVIGSE